VRCCTLVGFALWMDHELAWAQGRHEYQPMGVAVIARSDLFRERDFLRTRPFALVPSRTYVGLFASLGDLNAYLAKGRSGRHAGHKLRKK
jgi:hypothetical protein